jgi:polysaccharide biosynthesis transport protein
MASTGLPSMYGSGAAFAATEDQEAGLDVFGFLRRRKSFIIVLSLLGCGIGYMMFQRQIPIYRSSALAQVIHKSSDLQMAMLVSERNLMDAAFEIKSEGLLKPAIEKHRLGELSTLQGLSIDAAVMQVAGMIEVNPVSSNKIVEIAVQGSHAEEIPRIANAVAEEYVNRQRENYKDAGVELDAALTQQREQLHSELKEKEKEYNEFRDNSGLMSDGKNPHRERQQAFLSKLGSLSLEETSLKAELQTLEEAQDAGGSREAILMAIGKLGDGTSLGVIAAQSIGNTTSGGSIEEQMFPLFLEQKELEAKHGKDHPKVTAMQRRIDFTRQLLQQFAETKPQQTEQSPAQKAPVALDFTAVYLQSLRQQLQTIATERDALEIQAAEAERLARALSNDENEDRSRKSEIDRLTKLFDAASTNVTVRKVNVDMGGVKALVLQPAHHGSLVFPSLSKFLSMGAFLGGFIGLALGYLVEMADRSFRKPEDLIREFGIPIVGHIPFFKEERLKGTSVDTKLDRTAVCVHLPRSRPAEAYRSVRTAVCFSALGSTHRLIMVSSPAAGDGKSTLALNLSISLAMSGKRTILIESDFRRPKVHKLTGVDNKRGIVDVLRGDSELDDTVQSTSVESFFVLPCGRRPKDPAELLSRPEYEHLLDVLRQKYDYVIIDSPPVLAVTDPTSIAPRVDGVLIAMRLSRHTRDLGRRTLEQLRDVGATVSGIVINGVEESDGYGYGSYRYSDYQYSQKSYRYGYGYYGKSKENYYSDEPADASDADITLKS